MNRTLALVASFTGVLGLSLQPRSHPSVSLLGRASTIPTSVGVYDNVVSPQDCQRLHQQAVTNGLGHFVYTRSPTPVSANPIESVLDSILTQLEGPAVTTQYVEYWTRQEWRHIEAHADIDELRARASSEQEPYRYPRNGHVLYLDVGTEVRGPTCVFPHATTGSQLLPAPTDTTAATHTSAVELITVPAVAGRLLRFPGEALHAVPRPTDLWLLPFVSGAPRFDPAEEWGRSVVLFNTWEEPPLDIPLDVHPHTGEEEGVHCNDMELWESVPIPGTTNRNDPPHHTRTKAAKIYLLGDRIRRDCADRSVRLYVNEEELRHGLSSAKDISRLWLSGPSPAP